MKSWFYNSNATLTIRLFVGSLNSPACFPLFVSVGDYNKQINQFFSIFEQGRKMAAVDMLFVNDPWIALKSDSIHKTKLQLRDIEYLLGNYNSSVFVDQ
jgi:hypothetical protein